MAKCRVCHRELRNAAAIAAGVGPTCARRAASQAIVTTPATEQPTYPAEKIARINYMVTTLGEALEHEDRWTPRAYSVIVRWYARWQKIQRAVQV